jgi:low affinity Fe/Cu permease
MTHRNAGKREALCNRNYLSGTKGLTVEHAFTAIANKVSGLAGRPATFIAALAIILGWGLSGPLFQWSDTWQLVVNTGTTIITFLMVFLIQNSQNRDAAAMQAKLDELIRAVDKARAGFVGIEHLTDDEICRLRAALEREVGASIDKQATANETVERLLDRT